MARSTSCPDWSRRDETGTRRMLVEPDHRKLTTHQKAVLIQVLLSFHGQSVRICYSASASDGYAFAQDFAAIFKAIGWDVDGPELAEMLTGEPAGLAVIVSGNLPDCAEALRDTLRIYGIEAEARSSTRAEIAPGSFILWIGSPAQEAQA